MSRSLQGSLDGRKNDLRNFMLDIAKECDVTDRRFLLSRFLMARFEDPFVAAVSKEQSPALTGWWKGSFGAGSYHVLCLIYIFPALRPELPN